MKRRIFISLFHLSSMSHSAMGLFLNTVNLLLLLAIINREGGL